MCVKLLISLSTYCQVKFILASQFCKQSRRQSRYEIFAILGSYAPQIERYRRFGITYWSHLQGSSSLLFNHWRRDRRCGGNLISTLCRSHSRTLTRDNSYLHNFLFYLLSDKPKRMTVGLMLASFVYLTQGVFEVVKVLCVNSNE